MPRPSDRPTGAVWALLEQWSRDRKGYGRFTRRRTEDAPGSDLVHRGMYEELVGPIGEFPLNHVCRNTGCCNPDHLEVSTARENTLRGIGPAGVAARRQKCVHGHEFTPENTLIRKNGTRMCRACNAQRQRATKARRSARAAGLNPGISQSA